MDRSDGRAYTKDDFLQFYKQDGQRRWEGAPSPSGGEDRRKLTAILFLNSGWRGTDGGCVHLYDDRSKSWTSLRPEADTLVLLRFALSVLRTIITYMHLHLETYLHLCIRTCLGACNCIHPQTHLAHCTGQTACSIL